MSDSIDLTSSTEPAAVTDSPSASQPSAISALLGGSAPALARLHDAAPHARVLSNGRYWTLVTGAGTGLSQCGPMAVTRWSGDRVADHDGVLVYLRDLDSGETWSLGASPIGTAGGTFFARTSPGSVLLGRRHDGIEATSETCVAVDVDAEVRRISLRSRVATTRRIEVTVYTEIIAGWRGADDGHPAFAKLFVETAFDASTATVTARRRPRSGDEAPQWLAAALTGDGDLQWETDRARFVGRGRSVHAPAALASGQTRLTGSIGSVLDPVFALRRVVNLEGNGEASLTWILAAGASREGVIAATTSLKARSSDGKEMPKAAAAFEKARRRRFGLGADDAEMAQELVAAMLYAHPALAAAATDRDAASAAASPLGRLGIAAEALLVVAPVVHGDGAKVAALLVTTSYLASLTVPVAVVVLCEEHGCSAAACVHREAVAAASVHAVMATLGELGDDASTTLRAQARWLVASTPPCLADGSADAPKKAASRFRAFKADEAAPLREKLLFDNGYGGFSADGREYVMRVGPAALSDPTSDVATPMPWVNVVSNDHFGFLVSESGAGFTWSGNSRQNKLTPWSNDPVTDPHGEALYVRDNASGRFWSPQPGPALSGAWCEVRHGMGYSRWLQRAEAIEQEVTTYLAGDSPVRITRVRLANRGSRERKLSLYSFARLVLGVMPGDSSRFVVTSRDDATGVLLARNPLTEDHGSDVAFAAVIGGAADLPSWTTDRAAFVGRGGTMQAPRAVENGGGLDGTAGASAIDRAAGASLGDRTAGASAIDRAAGASLGGRTADALLGPVDPCFAFEVPVVLPPRGEVEIVFALGEAADRDAALAHVARLREAGAIDAAFEETRASWRDLTSAVEVQTPSKSIDLMLNGWLLYQTLGCRIHGRSAFYQSGGAFGFRDQLQDSAALVYARPDLSRAQILLHAAHQFVEGDVLHWWHPPADRGTRTRFSDDLLWLPYLAATYIGTTGDESVLEEKIPFVRSRLLNDGEDETYLQPEKTTDTASVYEHCCVALDRSLATGVHGLPLMGTGDWNDGMNRVGRLGKGESVWMAFFLLTILDLFVPMVEKRADWEKLRRYRQARDTLKAGIDASAWDGKWFRRAYYDDGTVLGSASSDECRIDAIAQAWAVLSGAATAEQARSAMDAVAEHLTDENAGIIRLLWPPFDRTTHDPGYIKGYVPGIRENGGQYTHGAIWVIRALAKMGDRQNASRLFEMVSPVTHARDRDAAALYKVEPYVVAADIYGADPHLGRGGWTWYTGSAAWMYRTGIESLLGLTIEEGRLLRVKPCVPDSWPGFRVKYRLPDRKTVYDIEVDNPTGRAASVVSASMGTLAVPVDRGGARIVLRRDGKLHKIKVVLG